MQNIDDTLAMRIVLRNNSGEICESHLVANFSTHFPAASCRYRLSFSLNTAREEIESVLVYIGQGGMMP